MGSVDEILKKITGSWPDIVWSVADITYSNSNFRTEFSRAIVIAQSYKHLITNKEYDEEKYHCVLLEAKISLEEKIIFLKKLLDNYGVKNFIPPTIQIEETELLSPFSCKYAAVQSGLGWIGKNDTLVTLKFGPRVHLGAILLDYPLECGTTIMESLCGCCHACVDACPCKAIKGANWNALSRKDDLLDYQSCNNRRSEYIEFSGRKHNCGHCILACPWGMKTNLSV